MSTEPPSNVARRAYPVAPSDWIPATGHQLGRAGERFDAVRMGGPRSVDTADVLIAVTGGTAGPIVREVTGYRWLYFLLPPGTATDHRWPPGTTHFGRTTAKAYVGVPALRGGSWPLFWYSPPCPEAPFVDPELLHRTLSRLPSAQPGAALGR